MAAPRAGNRRRRSNGIGCSEGLAVIRADSVARSIGGVCQICRAGRDGGSCDILACGVVGMVQSPHEWVAVWWDGSDGSDSSDVRKGQFHDFLDECRVVKMDANGLVNPRRRVVTAHNATEIAIKGRRLPKRDLELSASIPSKFGVKTPCSQTARQTY